MIKKYFYSGHKYWIDTTGYNYSKIDVGSKVICINDTIIYYSSFPRFGEIFDVKSIKRDGLFVSDSSRYPLGYNKDNINYLGTIRFDKEYKYSHTTLVQTHKDWLQRFVLLDDWKIFLRNDKLERICND